MTRIIALTALTTLGLSAAPLHEPVHARRGAVSHELRAGFPPHGFADHHECFGQAQGFGLGLTWLGQAWPGVTGMRRPG